MSNHKYLDTTATITDNLTISEQSVLVWSAEILKTAQAVQYKALELATGMSRKELKAAVKKLRAKGLMEYRKGLVGTDGKTKGSGFTINPLWLTAAAIIEPKKETYILVDFEAEAEHEKFKQQLLSCLVLAVILLFIIALTFYLSTNG